jgi:hypothetical protein
MAPNLILAAFFFIIIILYILIYIYIYGLMGECALYVAQIAIGINEIEAFSIRYFNTREQKNNKIYGFN